MKGEPHERAQKLLVAARAEGLSAADQAWLEPHLETCAGCAAYAKSLAQTVAAFRSFHVQVDPAVMDETRRRLRLRAQELYEHETRMWALWLACALSWVLGALSAPLLWWGFEWIGKRIDAPNAVWISAFVLWWLTPAAVVGAVLACQRSRGLKENGHEATLPR
jgi:predicted anti-sigma-YlaC factor YlaD